MEVTLEILARAPHGLADTAIRIVSENRRILRFNTQGYEEVWAKRLEDAAGLPAALLAALPCPRMIA